MFERLSNHAPLAELARPREPRGEMRSFDVIHPFELVALDVLGPLLACLSGERHVFVAIDAFMRFVHAVATSDVQATTAKSLRNYVGPFGAPESLLTDNAPTFVNSQVRQVLERFQITHRRSTPDHHEGNAQVERVIQTLQEELALITHDPALETDWRATLPSTILSINTTVQSSTGYTPFELLFGRKHNTKTSGVIEQQTLYDKYAELRELSASEM